MDKFIQLPAEEKLVYYEQAAAELNLPAVAIEKDFWVCWTLRELFNLPGWEDHITFKGGTSLSKVWKLIERFSEDIDLVISREYLGFSGDKDPESSPTVSQERKLATVIVDQAAELYQITPAAFSKRFHRFFKKNCQLTPDEYRRKMRD